MAVYVMEAAGHDPEALARARVIRDGFSWAAFLFGALWLLYRRLWLAFVLWVIGEAAFFILGAPYLTGAASLAVGVLAHLFLGLEAGPLRERKGPPAPVMATVVARDREDAEAIFLRRQLGGVVAP